MNIVFIVLAIILLVLFIIAASIYKDERELKFLKNELYNNIKNILYILPTLINTAKEEIKYEDEIFNNLESAKTLFNNSNNDIKSLSTCYSILSDNLSSLFSISEAYSVISSSEKFNTAKNEINAILPNIEEIKNNYNNQVNLFNDSIKKFPKNFIAKILKSKPMQEFDKKDLNNKINLDIEKDV